MTHADSPIPEVLYHYCPTESFYSIISSSSIWLSALTTSNDSLEGQWIKHVAAAVCEQEKLPQNIQSGILAELDILTNIIDGFGLCLSEADDILSQWRGYANDGAGVSIGFSTQYFTEIANSLQSHERPSFRISSISYDIAAQKDLLRPEIFKMKEQIDAGGRSFFLENATYLMADEEEIEERKKKTHKARKALDFIILSQLGNAFRLKNPAFSEEREWRILAISSKNAPTEVQYRPRASGLAPYRVVPISQSPIPAIVSVTTGPKYRADVGYIKGALDLFGFSGVEIRRSSASYR